MVAPSKANVTSLCLGSEKERAFATTRSPSMRLAIQAQDATGQSVSGMDTDSAANFPEASGSTASTRMSFGKGREGNGGAICLTAAEGNGFGAGWG